MTLVIILNIVLVAAVLASIIGLHAWAILRLHPQERIVYRAL
jgi:hypothetical protein